MKKYLPLLLITILVTAGIAFFFYYFGHKDDKALADFSTAYKNYDRAISALSTSDYYSAYVDSPTSDELVLEAHDALMQLTSKASARISSLTRHDAEIMSTTQDIANLSARELAALMAYRTAVSTNSADMKTLARALQDLRANRQAAYARFQALSGY